MSSTSLSGGNLVDGLPPVASLETPRNLDHILPRRGNGFQQPWRVHIGRACARHGIPCRQGTTRCGHWTPCGRGAALPPRTNTWRTRRERACRCVCPVCPGSRRRQLPGGGCLWIARAGGELRGCERKRIRRQRPLIPSPAGARKRCQES